METTITNVLLTNTRGEVKCPKEGRHVSMIETCPGCEDRHVGNLFLVMKSSWVDCAYMDNKREKLFRYIHAFRQADNDEAIQLYMQIRFMLKDYK